jgi:hypothetical protein
MIRRFKSVGLVALIAAGAFASPASAHVHRAVVALNEVTTRVTQHAGRVKFLTEFDLANNTHRDAWRGRCILAVYDPKNPIKIVKTLRFRVYVGQYDLVHYSKTWDHRYSHKYDDEYIWPTEVTHCHGHSS